MVAWQYGIGAGEKVQTAEPVGQSFYITKAEAMGIPKGGVMNNKNTKRYA